MIENLNSQNIFPSQNIVFDNRNFSTFVQTPDKRGYYEVRNIISTQNVEFTNWNQPINIDFQDTQNINIARQVADFISTGQPSKEWRISQQRPHSNNPYSRNLEVVLPDGQMLVIGGVLIQDKDLKNRKAEELKCTLPNPNKSLNQALGELGLHPQGYSTYHPDTKTITHHNAEAEILGGYTRESLSEKLSLQAMAEDVLRGMDIILPKTIISGSYQNSDFGAFYAYVKPITVNADSMLDIDSEFNLSGSASTVLPNAVFNLSRLVRKMHDRGFIHFQLHSGNWGLSLATYKGEKNMIYLGDFETCCYDPEMSLEAKIQDFGALLNQMMSPFQKNEGHLFSNQKYFDQMMFAIGMGYQDIDFDNKKRQYMFEKMKKLHKHPPNSRAEMVLYGQEYISWVLKRIYYGFDFMNYLKQFRNKQVRQV